MRLVSAVLFLALTGSGALADEAKPADSKPEVMRHKVPFRVVKMLPETGQVLLFDRDHGSHVVAEVGQMLDGYRVDDLDDETVTLVAENGTQIILAAPPPRLTRRAHARTPTAPADPYADASAPAPASAPAASATEGAGTPVDPYAEPAPPRTPGEGGVRVASAADPATTTSGSPAPATVSASTLTASASPPTAAVISDDPYADPGTAALADDPYADPGIAAFTDAVDATPAPATATPVPARSEGPAIATAPSPAPSATPPASPANPPPPPALDAKGAALASALTGAPAPSSTAASPSAPVAPPPPDLASPSFDEPTSSAPSDGARSSSADATTDRASAPATSTASAGATMLARAELDAALANFSTLASSFRATFTPAGLRLDTVRDGTLLTRVGLRKGDVITSIDGQPLRSLDDAANLYARASSLRAATIQVTRAGTPITLRVAIQ